MTAEESMARIEACMIVAHEADLAGDGFTCGYQIATAQRLLHEHVARFGNSPELETIEQGILDVIEAQS